MLTHHSLTVPHAPTTIAAEKLGWFRFGALGDRVVLTNEFGEWHVLAPADFKSLIEGAIDEAHAEHTALAAKGFLRSGLDPNHVAASLRRRKRFVGMGPSVHIVTLSEGQARLPVQVAKDILDFAMLSTSASLELRLRPGPLPIDTEQLGFLVQYGTEKNRYEGKALTWRLEADPALIDEATATWLVDKRFRVRAPWSGAFSPASEAGVARLQAAAAAKRREGQVVEVDARVGAAALAALAGLPGQLAKLGVSRFRVRPVQLGDDAVSPTAFAAAYGALLKGLIGGSSAVVEELGAAMVTRILRTDMGSDAELRSPTGAGLGVMSYGLDGTLYPGEHALLAEDPSMFALGKAGVTAYKEATRHPTLRALAVASLLECLPGFADHWATPYLGVDPLLTYVERGDLFAKSPTSIEVAHELAVIRAVLGVLAGSDEGAVASLTKWAEA